MVTIVIKDESISSEDIIAYIEKEHIEGEYEIITLEEYERRKAAEPVYEFKLPPSLEDLAVPGLIDLSAAAEEAERKERKFKKQQQKYAQRYASRRGWK